MTTTRPNRPKDAGQVIVGLALLVPLLLGLLGLVVDLGFLIAARARLQATADAAALAGVMELPGDEAAAQTAALEYVGANAGGVTQAEIAITDSGSRISVTVSQEVSFLFGPWIGLESKRVSAHAAARLGTASALSGVRPLAIVWDNYQHGTVYNIRYGQLNSGNFGSVALGGNGAANYRNNLANGYDGVIRVGQQVTSEPGNMAGPTEQGLASVLQGCSDVWPNISPGCSRVITVMVVDSFPQGRGQMTVLGFAVFFIEQVSGGQIRGRFMEWIVPGDIADGIPSYGVYASRLER